MAELGPEGQPGGPPSPTERARFESQLRWTRIFGVAFGVFLLLAVGLSMFHIFIGPKTELEVEVAESGTREVRSGQSRSNPGGSVTGTAPFVVSSEGEQFDIDDETADVMRTGGTYACTAQGFTWIPFLDRRLDSCTETEPPPAPPEEHVSAGDFAFCAQPIGITPQTGLDLADAADSCLPGGLMTNPGLYNCLVTGPAREQSDVTVRRCAKAYLGK